jgi:hypothetical protein
MSINIISNVVVILIQIILAIGYIGLGIFTLFLHKKVKDAKYFTLCIYFRAISKYFKKLKKIIKSFFLSFHFLLFYHFIIRSHIWLKI